MKKENVDSVDGFLQQERRQCLWLDSLKLQTAPEIGRSGARRTPGAGRGGPSTCQQYRARGYTCSMIVCDSSATTE